MPGGLDVWHHLVTRPFTTNDPRATASGGTRRFIFKRVDTVDAEALAHLGRRLGKRRLVDGGLVQEGGAPALSDYQEIRRFRSANTRGLLSR